MYIAEVLCFLNCTLLTVLVVWPVFWTPFFGILALCLLGITFVLYSAMKNEHCPFALIAIACAGLILVGVRATQTVWLILDRVGWAVTTPHEVEHFFLGKVVHDPGWLFYPFVLTIKSTPLTLPLVFLGCFLLWKYQKNSAETARQLKLVLALVSVVILFTVCLSLTSKKFSRYLLPVFPILEILVAIGFVEVIRLCFERFRIETTVVKRTIAGFACLCFFFIQILPVLMLSLLRHLLQPLLESDRHYKDNHCRRCLWFGYRSELFESKTECAPHAGTGIPVSHRDGKILFSRTCLSCR